MAVSKEQLKECIIDQREMVEQARIVSRPYRFEDNGCYVFVGIRHAGKSYLLYQRIQELLHNGHTWEDILFLNFDDERIAEFNTEDFNTLLENMVAVELMRRYGNDRVSYYNAGSEIDFVVEDARIAIQVAYDLQNEETLARELSPLRKFKAAHPEWQCFIVTFDTAGMYDTDKDPVAAVPVWQWLLS